MIRAAEETIFQEGVPPMFAADRIYSQKQLASATGRTVRSIRNWRTRGLLPAPDTLIGGRDPAWLGATLNASEAFQRPDAAQLAGLRPGG